MGKETKAIVKHVRYTRSEAEKLDSEASKVHMKTAAYIRMNSLASKGTRMPGEVMELLRDLQEMSRQIVNDIAVITKICQANDQASEAQLIELDTKAGSLVEKTDAVFLSIREAFKNGSNKADQNI